MVAEVTDENDVMEIPDFTESADTDQRFTCQVCDTPLVYSGRGRHPTYCEEHKPVRAATATAKRQPKGVAAIRSGMEQLYDMAGEGVTLLGKFTGDKALAIDGTLIGERSAVLAQQWADLAERDPEVRRALTQMTTGSSWGGVIITHVMLVGAIVMNHRVNGTPRVPKADRQPRRGGPRPVPNPSPPTRPQPQPQPRPAATVTDVPGMTIPEPGWSPGPDALFESGS